MKSKAGRLLNKIGEGAKPVKGEPDLKDIDPDAAQFLRGVLSLKNVKIKMDSKTLSGEMDLGAGLIIPFSIGDENINIDFPKRNVFIKNKPSMATRVISLLSDIRGVAFMNGGTTK